MIKSKMLLAGIAATAMLSIPVAANAITVEISDGVGGSFQIADNGLGDSDGAIGSIALFGFGIGDGTVTLSTAFVLDGVGNSQLTLNVGGATANTNDVGIAVSHAGFIGGSAFPALSGLDFTMNASNVSGTVTGASVFDNANGEFVDGGTIAAVGSISNTADSINGSAVAALSAPFSMSIFTNVTAGSTVTFDATSTAVVPVPAALPLFGTALLGLGLLGRRRARRS